MDLNLVVLCGRLAAPPEFRMVEGDKRLVRYLLSVRTEERLDVVPVTVWEPDEVPPDVQAGRRIWVAASLQRQFWDDQEGRRSRLEVVAHQVSGGATLDGAAGETQSGGR